MKKLTAIILSFMILVNGCMAAGADELPPAFEEWLPYAIERLQEIGMPDEEIAPFIESMAGVSDIESLSVDELNLWLETVILSIQHPEMSQDELEDIVSQGILPDQIRDALPDDGWNQSSDESSDSIDWNQSSAEGDTGSYEDASFLEGEDDMKALLDRYGETLFASIDSSVISHVFLDIEDSDQETWLKYSGWLADQAKHVLAPQAVGKLLQIPAFAKAKEEGLLSRYMSFAATYDPQTGYSAQVTGAPLNAEGKATETEDQPVAAIGYRLNINLSENGPTTQSDNQGRLWLEDILLHEMTHAFMNDFNRNGMIGTDREGIRHYAKNEDGTNALDMNGFEINMNAFPDWFCEGTATTVQAGYAARRGELLEFFGYDEDDKETVLDVLTNLDKMIYYLTAGGQTEPGLNGATLKDIGNAYNVGYIACMYLYSMAAKKLGLTPCPDVEDGFSIDKAALFEGFNDILQRSHDGQSLDEIIAQISMDPETGEPAYADVDDFEAKFAQNADDPGLAFWQTLMLAYESQATDPDTYLPTGSILPGYDNAREHYLDQEQHEGAGCYDIVENPDPDPNVLTFPMSTVQPSKTALGGGRSISYDPVQEPLTQDEAASRDVLSIGDNIVFARVE